jgi:hypothetical protein
MGRWVKNPKIDGGALTVEIPHVTTSQRPAGKNGQIIYNTTTSTYQSFIGSQWYNVSTAAGTKTITVDTFQGDGSTQTFGNGVGNTLDGSTAANLSFSVADEEDILVFIGGVYQIPNVNYTVSGNTITFGSVVSANDGISNDHIITIIHGLHKLGE